MVSRAWLLFNACDTISYCVLMQISGQLIFAFSLYNLSLSGLVCAP